MNDDEAPLVLQVGDAGELVAGLPVMFGFTPRESLVVLSLAGDRDRVGFRLRHDLVLPEESTVLAEQLAEVLLRHRVSAVLVVGCSIDPVRCDANVQALCTVLECTGIAVREALRCAVTASAGGPTPVTRVAALRPARRTTRAAVGWSPRRCCRGCPSWPTGPTSRCASPRSAAPRPS